MQVRADGGRVFVGDVEHDWWDMTPSQARRLAELLLAAATMASGDTVDAYRPSKRHVPARMRVAEGDTE